MPKKRNLKELLADQTLTDAEKLAQYKTTYYSEWDKVKGTLMKRVNKCQCCGRTKDQLKSGSLEIHHNSYDHLCNELEHLDDLIVVCPNCHKKIHSMPHNLSSFKPIRIKMPTVEQYEEMLANKGCTNKE